MTEIVALCTLIAGSGPAHTDELLFVDWPRPRAERTQVARFVEELELVLDTAVTDRVPSPSPDFERVSPRLRANEVRGLLDQDGAVAVAWLATSEESLALYLLREDAGRLTLRRFAAGDLADPLPALALVVREQLLGAGKNVRVSTVHETRIEVDEPLPAPPPPPRLEPPEVRRGRASGPVWAVEASARAQLGLLGQEGPSTILGGAIAVGINATTRLRVGVTLRGGTHVDARARDGSMRSWLAAAGVVALWRVPVGPFRLGSEAGLELQWHSLDLDLGTGPSEEHLALGPRLYGGLHVSWPISEHISLFQAIHVGWLPFVRTYVRRSDQSTVLRTPHADGSVGVGLVTHW